MAIETPTLAHYAAARGELIRGAGNRPIDLRGASAAWYVESGSLDVFLMEQGAEGPVSGAEHLLRAESGQLVFGFSDTIAPVSLFGKGQPGSRFRRLELSEIAEGDAGAELDGQVERWVTALGAAVAGRITPRPRPTLILDAAGQWQAPAGSVVSTRPGVLLWAALPPGSGLYLSTEEPAAGSLAPIPLTPDTWLAVHDDAPLEGYATGELRRQGRLVSALAAFQQLAIATEYLNQRLLLADAVNAQAALATHRRGDEYQARRSLFGVLRPPRAVAEAAGSELMPALNIIGEHENVTFIAPPRRAHDAAPTLLEILEASGVRSRKVRLTSEDRWWLGDSGAMLGFRREDGSPVALLPSARVGRYRAVDPASGDSKPINGRTATQLSEDAWCFYRPLPADRSIDTRTLLGFAARGVAPDLWRFAIAGIITNFLTLTPAITLGVLAEAVLPAGRTQLLAQVMIGLVAFAFLLLVMRMLQGTAAMRVEGRVAARLSAALWDRLLALPPSFFRQFTAGELATRVSVFQDLRDRLSGIVANALLSFIFFMPMLILLFLYDVRLAWLTVGIGAATIVITAAHGILQIAPQRRRYSAARRISGDLFQFINGISKLRSTGAEASAYALWARSYREQHRASLQIARLNAHLSAFIAAAPSLFTAILFAEALSRDGELSAGSFLVVFGVAMIFYAAAASLGRSFEALAAILPAYEQVHPLLQAVPEQRFNGTGQVDLQGELHLDQVSFRYSEDGPRVLDDVSIHARPGEFIALVGESGSGKSTLLRLALGLEDPTGGSVYYDGRDLAHLDRNSVRRQVGVVMQDGALQPGNILDNIIGLSPEFGIEDAWRAAALAAVDADIRAMPMQMFTIVSNGSTTFSGGQTQRIRIAASLVRNPPILFLDEATSWLDAQSQAQVMAGIESLAATRIVIAHRLSTIRKADRIYVLHQGRVAQQGSFAELYEAEGIFRDLVQRQLA